MPTLNKLPWVSSALLMVTYSTLGWVLAAFHDPWFVWVMIVVAILLLAAFLSTPGAKFRDTDLFKSDTRTFSFVVAAAFLSVMILWRLHIFVHALVTISAAILVRLEAQEARLSNRQTFWILASISLTGLGLGAAAQTAIYLNS